MQLHHRAVIVSLAIASGMMLPAVSRAQDAHQHDESKDDLTKIVDELRRKVAKLEAALERDHTGRAPAERRDGASQGHGSGTMGGMGGTMGGSGGMGGMGGMGRDSGGMGMMGGKMGGSGGMGGMGGDSGGMGMMRGKMGGSGGMGGMGRGSGGMGMMGGMMGGSGGMGHGMMGRMGRMGQGTMPTPSALPGFPGASHIYHVGSTGFFLDHAEHLGLDDAQIATLAKIKEKALLENATFERKIEEGEQELWVLTAADSPDASKIEKKIDEVADLAKKKRLSFIRAVGEAAQTLTERQRKTVTGLGAPEKPDADPSHADH